MRRIARKSMLVKTSFIKGVRDARAGIVDSHPEIQQRLEEIHELEKFNHGNATPNNRMMELYKEIANIREAYITAMEMATLEPNKSYLDLLSEFTGEDIAELRIQIYQLRNPKKQSERPESRAHEVELKRPKAPTSKEILRAEKQELLLERAKIIGGTALLMLLTGIIAYVENMPEADFEKMINDDKSKTMHSQFVQQLNPNSDRYTQSDGTTYTYTVPNDYGIDRE